MATLTKIRTKDGIAEVNLTRNKAIKLKCMDCSCFQRNEVEECTDTHCPIFIYRNGNACKALRSKSKILAGNEAGSRFTKKIIKTDSTRVPADANN